MAKSTWEDVPDADTVRSLIEQGMMSVTVAGKDICIGIYQQNLFACAARCPHAGASLADGYIDSKGNIVCPAHGYKFRLKDGFNSSGEGFRLKVYEVKVDDENIQVELPEVQAP